MDFNFYEHVFILMFQLELKSPFYMAIIIILMTCLVNFEAFPRKQSWNEINRTNQKLPTILWMATTLAWNSSCTGPLSSVIRGKILIYWRVASNLQGHVFSFQDKRWESCEIWQTKMEISHSGLLWLPNKEVQDYTLIVAISNSLYWTDKDKIR